MCARLQWQLIRVLRLQLHVLSQTLRRRVAAAAATNVSVTCADFLTVDPRGAAYARVDAVLLDPSCSGSGMTHRLDHALVHDRCVERWSC